MIRGAEAQDLSSFSRELRAFSERIFLADRLLVTSVILGAAMFKKDFARRAQARGVKERR